MSSVHKSSSLEKSITFFLRVIKFVFVIVLIINFVFPIVTEHRMFVNVVRVFILGIWVFALAGSLGYVKHAVTRPNKEGIVKYDTTIPLVPIAMFRIFELVYLLIFRSGDVLWRNFLFCIAADVVFVILLFVDKSNYYYESIDVQEE